MICISICFYFEACTLRGSENVKSFIKLHNRDEEEEDRRKVQFCRRSKSNIRIRRKYKFDTAFDKSRKAFHIGCAKWGNTNLNIYHTENPFRWYVCCSKGCKSSFRKQLADGDFSEVDNSLEARRVTENAGMQNIDEDFVSRDEEYDEEERSDRDNARVSPTKKSGYGKGNLISKTARYL